MVGRTHRVRPGVRGGRPGHRGLGLGNEGTNELADDLATLVSAGEPSPTRPIRLTIDVVLAALTLGSVALGVRNLRRTPVWVGQFGGRPGWRRDCCPGCGGRDITFSQLGYYSPALVTWAAVATVMNSWVLTARMVALARRRDVRSAPM